MRETELFKFAPDSICYLYAMIKAVGHQKLGEEINDSMVVDPVRAWKLIIAAGNLYRLAVDPLKATSSFSLADLTQTEIIAREYRLGKPDRKEYMRRPPMTYVCDMDGPR